MPLRDIRQAINTKVVFAITQPNTPDPDHERNGKAGGAHLLVGVMRKGIPRLPTDQTAKFMRLCNRVLAAEYLQGEDVGIRRRRARKGFPPPGEDMRNAQKPDNLDHCKGRGLKSPQPVGKAAAEPNDKDTGQDCSSTYMVWSYGPLSTEDRKEMTANEGHHALRDTIDGPLEAYETKV